MDDRSLIAIQNLEYEESLQKDHQKDYLKIIIPVLKVII